MDPVTAGLILQGLGLFKGSAGGSGSGAPVASSSNGNFANQVQMFGIPDYTPAMGGMGPIFAQGFTDTAPARPDSLVMGLTGQSTTAAASLGINGLGGINLGSGSGTTLALIAGAVMVAVLILKK